MEGNGKLPPADAKLRSTQWFGATGRQGFVHRSHTKSQGFPNHLFDGRPVIGIITSWSELTPCNAHLHDLAQSVKAGVYEAGGFPVEVPVMGLGETLLRPTAMLYRNLAAMEVEEIIRANPLDGVVLLSGCDKTTPALLMGATSVDLPTVLVTGGPMVNGRFCGRTVGSGTDVWKFAENVRAGTMTPDEFIASETGVSRGAGHCTTMGTASSMACITEAMGLQFSGSAAIPAVDGNRKVVAHHAGYRAVQMVRDDIALSTFMTRESFENAITTLAAIGGSTNAVIHLLALAGRSGVPVRLSDFDTLGSEVPTLLNLRPSGEYLMEDFAAAGGMPALMTQIRHFLHLGTPTVSGKTLGEEIDGAVCYDTDVIRPIDDPLLPAGSATIVLNGNLCPNGALLKVSAASPELLAHRGKALVFDSVEAYNVAADDENLDVTADSVIVLRNCGPRGYPGMPEVGNLPIPKRLLKHGVRDMVRICDARMSGTAFGTVVLHVAPEASIGGPLALVEDGDWIELDGKSRTLELKVAPNELERRRGALRPQEWGSDGGYTSLYRQHVLQADQGCDFDFLVGRRGSAVPRQSY